MASLPPGAFGAMLREDVAAGGETGAEAAALMDMLAELGANAGFPPGTTPLELEAILRGGETSAAAAGPRDGARKTTGGVSSVAVREVAVAHDRRRSISPPREREEATIGVTIGASEPERALPTPARRRRRRGAPPDRTARKIDARRKNVRRPRRGRPRAPAWVHSRRTRAAPRSARLPPFGGVRGFRFGTRRRRRAWTAPTGSVGSTPRKTATWRRCARDVRAGSRAVALSPAGGGTHTALHWAAARGETDAARWLLEEAGRMPTPKRRRRHAAARRRQ